MTSHSDIEPRTDTYIRPLVKAVIDMPLDERLLFAELLQDVMCIRCGRDDVSTGQCTCDRDD